MKRKVTLAAYLAGATTLAVSLPVMAETTMVKATLQSDETVSQKAIMPDESDRKV